jgi:hypothetical protein
MLYRLLIDYEVLQYVSSLKRPHQQALHHKFRSIQADPSGNSDYLERDPTGRPLHVSICAGLAITYWEDFADRHIKILEVKEADRI